MVALGGSVGAVSRYLLHAGIERRLGTGFPFGTLVVNLLGCLAIGLVLAHLEARDLLDGSARLLLVTGFLGAFTTFSTFGIEVVTLADDGGLTRSLAYVALSVVLGTAAVLVGRWAAQLV